ncbi:MAG: cupredoxin family copper-binding protein [Chloroflexi bacterium]|nr:cupredoxin family copper-binding protein [Chloroflexota bacterium]
MAVIGVFISLLILSACRPSPTPTPPAGAIEVTIQSFAFSPATLTIKKGTTVTWTNKDSVPHTVKGWGTESSSMGAGQSYSYKFDSAGTYDYICGVHPYMKATVVVTE